MKSKAEIMNRLFAYSPNLKQSWILAIIVSLGGGAVSFAAIVTIGIVLGKPIGAEQDWFTWLIGISTEGYISLFSYLMGAVFVIWVVCRLGKDSNYTPVPHPRQSPLLWLLLAPFALSIIVLAELHSTWIPMPETMKSLAESIKNNPLPNFLMIVVIAPVFEEWLYRGIILKGLLTHYSPLKAIMWSAVIFGIVHLNLWQGISAFCGTIAVGWIYWQTRSLWHCIFIHAVNNIFSFLGALFNSGEAITFADFAGGYYIYPVALFICVFTVVGIKKVIVIADTQNC
jgi:membrane protease YdiL (CAAX protease family)